MRTVRELTEQGGASGTIWDAFMQVKVDASGAAAQAMLDAVIASGLYTTGGVDDIGAYDGGVSGYFGIHAWHRDQPREPRGYYHAEWTASKRGVRVEVSREDPITRGKRTWTEARALQGAAATAVGMGQLAAIIVRDHE